jgi:hypothetical protein
MCFLLIIYLFIFIYSSMYLFIILSIHSLFIRLDPAVSPIVVAALRVRTIVGYWSSLPGANVNVSSPQGPHRLWGPPRLLCTLYQGGALSQGLMWPERDAEHYCPCIAGVQKDWRCTATRTPRLISDRSVNLFIYF